MATVCATHEMTVHAVYNFTGLMFDENAGEVIPAYDPEGVLGAAPAHAHNFKLFEVHTLTTEDGTVYTAKPSHVSPTYWIDAELIDYADVPQDREHRILRDNMETNGWDKVVKTRSGGFREWTATDVFLSSAEEG